MNKNKQLIIRFYTAFQQLDFETMNSCYHEEAQFQDPVFNLDSKKEIAGMWKMLCTNAKNFDLTFSEVTAEKYDGSACWEASYEFSRTRRKVANKIEAKFYFMDGKIIEHADSFSFWRWSRMALGFPGYLLGWSPFLKKKIQGQAKKNLYAFISENSQKVFVK
ncbi:MAG: nuclear transport factor 2 family protein [Balneolaceae bacterium]